MSPLPFPYPCPTIQQEGGRKGLGGEGQRREKKPMALPSLLMQAIIFHESRHVRNLSRTRRPYQEELRSAECQSSSFAQVLPLLCPFARPILEAILQKRPEPSQVFGPPHKGVTLPPLHSLRRVFSVILARPFVSSPMREDRKRSYPFD